MRRFAEAISYDLIGLKSVDGIRSALASTGLSLGDAEVECIASLVLAESKMRNTILQLTKSKDVVLTAAMFSQVMIWWIGADQIDDVNQYENKGMLKTYMEQCCQVGIFNIVEADKWASLSALSSSCEYVLERCNKEFFMDVDLPRNININLNSFQLHSRGDKKHTIVRTFSI